ncbi:hypothetical protein M427DRAFT_459477 [Gonapodya prolifera JEL478]|uniref:Uncharacterized protein n=1 Tax=Gonapodya prolifera (strain JEL478) TaxID=1344416 RepID=A0A139A268_GONPJ|nr:hypothetical protein M427DRAFT_459477 [Gonapodya prolifera JEL478]|eukprot:KXS10886.1 hypothetical protein M427DRAFT_459477 [Gonapodya prolifera JEL478]
MTLAPTVNDSSMMPVLPQPAASVAASLLAASASLQQAAPPTQTNAAGSSSSSSAGPRNTTKAQLREMLANQFGTMSQVPKLEKYFERGLKELGPAPNTTVAPRDLVLQAPPQQYKRFERWFVMEVPKPVRRYLDSQDE